MTLLEWPEYGLFEYEYDLAKRELAALTGVLHTETSDGVVVDAEFASIPLDDLTYFAAAVEGGRRSLTTQSRIERTHREITGRRGQRQSTRFLVHDFHEYKGKFNPQMARALINVYGTHADVVIDPFSGSGTTLIEAARLGKDAHGIDRNPLAVWIARVKAAVTTCVEPKMLLREFEQLITAIDDIGPSDSNALEDIWESSTRDYLAKWFPPHTLSAIARMLQIAKQAGGTAGDLLALVVSNVARAVSYQNPADLRVRRIPAGAEPPELSDVMPAAIRKIRFALEEHAARTTDLAVASNIEVIEGDASELRLTKDGRRKVIVTSPPYATALPYVDTDRLSILLLGIARSDDLRRLDRQLIGSREWDQREARIWNSRLHANADHLPSSVIELCLEIEASNEADGAGFRRAAVPGLLYRYFAQMRDAISNWSRVLDIGERAVLVVGENRTGRGGRQMTIPTPHLLAECGAQVGFAVEELLPFQVWARYGIHGRNGVPGEYAVVLTRR